MRLLLSPIGLVSVIGLVGGLFVSDLFRGIASRQAAQPYLQKGPIMPSQAPLAYSDKLSPVSDDGIIRVSAEALRVNGGTTSIELAITFHTRPEYSSYEIGTYEPPSLVDRAGGLLMGSADFPPDHHFRGGETYRTIVSFPGTPASWPDTLTLYMGERLAGQYHMTSVSLTGLSPSLVRTP